MSKRTMIKLLCLAVGCIALGAVLAFWADAAHDIFCYLLGGLMVAYGLFSAITYFFEQIDPEHMQLGLAIGAACILLGAYILFRAAAVIQALELIVGLVVIVDSVLRLQMAVNIRRANGGGWLPILVCAAVTLAAGLVLLFNPFRVARTATIAAGVALMLDGALALWCVIRYRFLIKKIAAATPAAAPLSSFRPAAESKPVFASKPAEPKPVVQAAPVAESKPVEPKPAEPSQPVAAPAPDSSVTTE